MGVLTCAGEEIDFTGGGILPVTNTSTDYHNVGYARGAIDPRALPGYTISKSFIGGAVTSCWFTFRFDAAGQGTGKLLAGLGLSSDYATGKGLWLATDATTQTKLTLVKRDGTNNTVLDTEDGTSFPSSVTCKIDIQVTTYADTVNGNAKVYVDGGSSPILEYTGDLTVTGLASLDCIILRSPNTTVGFYTSEFIVATDDTRTYRLVTIYPNDTGSLLEWTGAYSTIDEAIVNDADLAYVNSTGKKAQYAMSDTPAGTWSVPAIMIVARACKNTGASVGKLKLGVLSGGSEDVGSAETMTTAWDTYRRLTTTINGSSISTATIDALELHLESLT